MSGGIFLMGGIEGGVGMMMRGLRRGRLFIRIRVVGRGGGRGGEVMRGEYIDERKIRLDT